MRRSLFALAVVAVLVVTTSVPASAASWFQLRVNPSSGDWRGGSPGFSDLPYTFTANMFGLTGFWQPPGFRLGLRGNLDTGSLSSFSAGVGYTGGNWRWWDLSLGLPLPLGPATALIFAGMGDTTWQADVPGGFSRQTTSGMVFGADVWVPLREGRWYVYGHALFGPSHNYRYANLGFDPRFTGKADVANYSAALGYNFPGTMNSIELGWRSGGFRVKDATPVFPPDSNINGMETRWSGVYLGVVVRRP
ncbi:MAG: hypothetical protein QN187_08325 [Armatimonadota bacterium]|nr:hypothetical protein [Armatimonadota bacterium]MDR7520665.1 hypothetical protein [Armatimonadota bacterium]MDR7548921.1 hypothetical protein [Armatimonadota bacterium]